MALHGTRRLQQMILSQGDSYAERRMVGVVVIHDIQEIGNASLSRIAICALGAAIEESAK